MVAALPTLTLSVPNGSKGPRYREFLPPLAPRPLLPAATRRPERLQVLPRDHRLPVLLPQELTEHGHRAVATDLVGFGRSDKPVQREDYTYQRHVDWMRALVEGLNLRNVTLVGQDWGGLIGLRLAAEHADRFARIVAANTFLPKGDRPAGEAFLRWQRYSQETPEFHVGGIVKGGCATELSPEVIAAYDAPFPDDRYKGGARMSPVLVPTSPDDAAVPANRRAWEILQRWEKPFLTAFSDSDPVTRGGDRLFQQLVPGTSGQPHTTVEGAGHFLQEDKGEQLAEVIVDFIARTPSAASPSA